MATTSSDTLKDQGNQLYKNGEFAKAAEAYTQALHVDPSNEILYSNRSAACFNLGELQQALEDAEKAISIKPSWHKGHFRKAMALEAQDKLDEALSAYQLTLEHDSNNRKDLRAKIKELKQKTRRPTTNVQLHDGPMQAPTPSQWAHGLSPDKAAEWLVDCYRMRVDDDYALGGGNMRGLYDHPTSKAKVLKDFLLFCKLAVCSEVVPAGWDWALFLEHAREDLMYAFEKSDAQKKWAGENVFRALLGGRSLRATAEVVYGTTCRSPSGLPVHARSIQTSLNGGWRQLVSQAEGGGHDVFEDVGGLGLWRELHEKIPSPRVYEAHW